MSSVNKHKVLQEWVSDFLEDNYLFFQRADAYPNTRILFPQYGDYVVRKDILGAKYKTYTFVFIGYDQTSTGTDDTNSDVMQVFDDFNAWIETKQEEHDYPDFGTNCSDYEIQPLQNMANLATITEDGLAKYMLAVRIDYKEED